MLLDEKHGRRAMAAFDRHGLSWLGRPVERPGSRPLRFELSPGHGSPRVEWPGTHCVKCLALCHPDDPAALKAEQQETLRALFEASRKIGRELLIEIIAGRHGPVSDDTVARALEELYALGIRPDWWKLEPQATPAAWAAVEATIQRHDPHCRGVVMLGLEASHAELERAFAAASGAPIVKGFAVGRSLFMDAAEAWFAGRIDDEAAIADMADRFGKLTRAWLAARGRQVRLNGGRR